MAEELILGLDFGTSSVKGIFIDFKGTILKRVESKIETKLRNNKLTNLGIDLDKIASSKIKSDIKMYNFSGEESSKLINGLKIGVGAISGYLLMMFVINFII